MEYGKKLPCTCRGWRVEQLSWRASAIWTKYDKKVVSFCWWGYGEKRKENGGRRKVWWKWEREDVKIRFKGLNEIKNGFNWWKIREGATKSIFLKFKNTSRAAWHGSCPVIRAAMSGHWFWPSHTVELTQVVSPNTGGRVSLLENHILLGVLSDTGCVRWHGLPCQGPIFFQKYDFFLCFSLLF